MTPKDWESLAWGLRQGHCILVLGDESGGPAERTRRDGLTKRLRDELKNPPPEGLELAQIAWLYQSENSRNDLLGKVDAFYADWTAAPLEVHTKLAAVPFHCIVTSSQDGSMEAALKAAGKTPQVAAYEFRGRPEALAGNWTSASPLLYHLFGNVGRPKSLVLTEQDLVDFIVAVVAQNPPVPEALRAELRDPEKMFLFLGFGVRHWYPRVLLQVLKAQAGNSRSFALEEFPPPKDLSRGVFFYQYGYKVEVFDSSVTQFVDELHAKMKDVRPVAKGAARASSEAPSPAASGPPDGPATTVFICHDHDDAALAERVAGLLRANGLEPWLDKQSLDIGEDWLKEIERQISEVDYFLVLVTPALAGTAESVAFQELSIARQRLPRLRARRFILPLRCEGAAMLDELAEFHQGPVRGEAGEEPLVLTPATEATVIERLASSIRRDVQRRLKKGA
jgi:hypothetical protein